MVIKMNEVIFTSVRHNEDADGTATVGLNFAQYYGPVGGFQQ